MEFGQLRYFLKIAELGTFTRAGEELGMTQPALSRAVEKLEEELGQPVFERRARRIELTDAGRILQTRAEQILALVDDTLAELGDSETTGAVRVGAIPTIAPYLLPIVLRDFRDRLPGVHVVAYEETTDKLLHRCNQGEVDVAVMAAPIVGRYLEAETLFEEELFAVLPTGHPLAARKTISLADLRQQPFVLLDDTHCLSETILSFCRQRAFQPVAIQHTCQLATVEELVSLGHGVSLIPRMARNADTSDRRVYRPISAPTPTRTVVMIWNPYRFQSKRMKRLQECLRRAAKTNGAKR